MVVIKNKIFWFLSIFSSVNEKVNKICIFEFKYNICYNKSIYVYKVNLKK